MGRKCVCGSSPLLSASVGRRDTGLPHDPGKVGRGIRGERSIRSPTADGRVGTFGRSTPLEAGQSPQGGLPVQLRPLPLGRAPNSERRTPRCRAIGTITAVPVQFLISRLQSIVMAKDPSRLTLSDDALGAALPGVSHLPDEEIDKQICVHFMSEEVWDKGLGIFAFWVWGGLSLCTMIGCVWWLCVAGFRQGGSNVYLPILLAAVTVFAPMDCLRVRRRHRQYRWFLTGHCPHCGYDLRATTDLCPECGKIPTKPKDPFYVWLWNDRR